MKKSEELLLSTMEWIKSRYPEFRFVMERDLVWTIQKQLVDLISANQLPLRVYNDYPMLPSTHRSLSVDLAIVNDKNLVELAVEFKFEPSHKRKDITSGKFPVVSKEGVQKDILRAYEFIEKEKADVTYSVFLDEGGYFLTKIHSDHQSRWIDWGKYDSPIFNVHMLITRFSN